MRLIKCKRCGKEFNSDKRESYICPECAQKSRKAPTLIEHTCSICGTVFVGGPMAKYCQDCREKIKRKREREYRRSDHPKRKIGSVDICKSCGKEYIVMSGRQMYCDECRDAVSKEKTSNRKKEYNAEHALERNKKRTALRNDLKVCLICGKTFSANGSPTTTCSEECKKKLKFWWQAMADYKRGRRSIIPNDPRIGIAQDKDSSHLDSI